MQEKLYGKPVVIAYRDTVESKAEDILHAALTETVCFLVVGDPFCATTHSDLFLRAKELNIKVQVIHNASIMNAIGSTGLQLYRFGQTISIPFFTETWQPDSWKDKIAFNDTGKLHTLCLLDIQVREPDLETLFKPKIKYLPPRFMTVNDAIRQMFIVEDKHHDGVLARNRRAVGVARLGQSTQQIVYGTLEELETVDFGAPLHSLILVGETHELEDEMLNYYSVTAVAGRAAAEAAATAAATATTAETASGAAEAVAAEAAATTAE